jgi:hypothetical protein
MTSPTSNKDNRPPQPHGSHPPKRSSMPYPIPERLKGRLQPPPNIPSYIMQNPRLRPYAAACMATDEDTKRLGIRIGPRQAITMSPISHNEQPDHHSKCSPETMPHRYRASLNQTQLSKLLSWLPLPPDPTHPYWEGRCFDLLTATKPTNATGWWFADHVTNKAILLGYALNNNCST